MSKNDEKFVRYRGYEWKTFEKLLNKPDLLFDLRDGDSMAMCKVLECTEDVGFIVLKNGKTYFIPWTSVLKIVLEGTINAK